MGLLTLMPTDSDEQSIVQFDYQDRGAGVNLAVIFYTARALLFATLRELEGTKHHTHVDSIHTWRFQIEANAQWIDDHRLLQPPENSIEAALTRRLQDAFWTEDELYEDWSAIHDRTK